MDSIFIVHHTHEFEDGTEDVKLIGVYSTKENSERAINRLKKQPGFCKIPEGFETEEYEINEDHWTEGFCTPTQ